MLRHARRVLSRGHPRGLFASNGRGTGKPSAESFDDASTSSTRSLLKPRVLALLSLSDIFRLDHHLAINSGARPLRKDYPFARQMVQATANRNGLSLLRQESLEFLPSS
jgi:hypothetical protein